ncbi:MAG: helix-turn-helix transcriptional regulator [Gemmiger sp.]
MLFFCNQYAAAAETRELRGDAAARLAGEGLWVGVLSSGSCLLGELLGHGGDILLGEGPCVLEPQQPCHLLAVRLTGQCAGDVCRAAGPAHWAGGEACPGAAELIAALCGSGEKDDRLPFALLCALAHADEAVHRLPPLVAAALAAMRGNYMELYGVEELSEQLGVSKSHLVRVFSAEMGITPGRFLTQTRLEAAKQLLLENEHTLETIAGLCGFSGANYLCRVFKRETGMTPAAWRAAATPVTAVPNRSLEAEKVYL